MISQANEGAQSPTDPFMAKIMAAVALLYAGDLGPARTELESLWSCLGPYPDAFHVCVLSHFIADLQGDVRQELEWDLRALHAAEELTDERVRQLHPSLSVAGFLPSLHLNVADAAFRAGDLETARRYLEICLELEAGLSDSPFDTLTRKGIEGLALRLASAQSEIMRTKVLNDRS